MKSTATLAPPPPTSHGSEADEYLRRALTSTTSTQTNEQVLQAAKYLTKHNPEKHMTEGARRSLAVMYSHDTHEYGRLMKALPFTETVGLCCTRAQYADYLTVTVGGRS